VSDPLAAVWEALERGGHRPHGRPWDYRARCPVHDGKTDGSLHVFTGADGQAIPYCFAGCPKEEIVRAIGLTIGDLYPAGHHHARRRKLPEARRADFAGHARTVANTLAALQALGGDWYLELRCDCPYCGSPAALLQASPKFALYRCPGDDHAERLGYTACTLDQFLQALAGRIEGQRKAA
jgi:hypothetical protein